MKKKTGKKEGWTAETSELAMIEGIIEGSPDAVGVVVVRMQCGCRKMAAVSKDGEPASKIIMYRDKASTICSLCKEDNGAYQRVGVSFIHWKPPEPSPAAKSEIELKVLGSRTH